MEDMDSLTLITMKVLLSDFIRMAVLVVIFPGKILGECYKNYKLLDLSNFIYF